MTKFVNPYTFIGLGNKKSEGGGKGQLTGVLHCTLRTLTPLVIPSAANENAFPNITKKHVDAWNIANSDKKVEKIEYDKVRSLDFFSYDNPKCDRQNVKASPVIPGSSIRGMIRSIYETLTDSCLSSVDDDMVVNKRSVIPYDRDRNSDNMGVGVVEKDGANWVLRKGKKALLPIKDVVGFKPVYNKETRKPLFKLFSRRDLPSWGSEIYILLNGKYGKMKYAYPVVSSCRKTPQSPQEHVAYHLPGMPFSTECKKHFDTIVYDYKTTKSYTLTPQDIERVKKIASLYISNNEKNPHYKGWGNFDSGKPFPVYFENVGGVYYISPACISQEVFARKVGEMVGDFGACKDSAQLCEACRLFGMVGDSSDGDSDKINAVASRVAFRDATSSQESDWYDEPKPLAILGQPRPSATEFYMKPPEKPGDYFNYDYKVSHDSGFNKKEALSATIKGRKFYWHSDNKCTRYADTSGRLDLSIIVRPVKTERRFTFDVAFENVTEEELAKLVWILTIGGKTSSNESNPLNAFKLGHGKPIGFGSVGITVDSEKSVIFEINDALNIVCKPLNCIQSGLPDVTDASKCKNPLKHIDEFATISSWANRQKNVMYPKHDGTGDIFAWFGANRKGILKKNGAPDSFNLRFINRLPDISDAPGSQEMFLSPQHDNGNISPAKHVPQQKSNPQAKQTNRSKHNNYQQKEAETPVFSTLKKDERSGNSAFDILKNHKFGGAE